MVFLSYSFMLSVSPRPLAEQAMNAILVNFCGLVPYDKSRRSPATRQGRNFSLQGFVRM